MHDGAALGPLTMPLAWGGTFSGYHAMVFPHEQGHFSVVIIRPTADVALQRLRHRDAFEAACRAIPALGGVDGPGPLPCRRPTCSSAVACATSTASSSASRAWWPWATRCRPPPRPSVGAWRWPACRSAALLDLLDGGADPVTIGEPFGDWCDEHIRPWVEDHIARDDESVQRLQGADIDLSRPLTSTAIVDAAQVDQRILEHVGGFLGMRALPATLAPAEPLARAAYAVRLAPAVRRRSQPR